MIIIIILAIMLLLQPTLIPSDTVSQKSDELDTQTIEAYTEEETTEETTEEVVESEPTSEVTTEDTTEEVIVEEPTTEDTTEEITTEATPEDTTEEITTEATTEATTEEITQEPTTTAGQEPTTTAGDLGILNIPNAGIYVGLYSDGNAFQSRGKASVEYYNQYGIKWIADHVNQDGFWNLKNLSIGSTVYINDTAYTVVDNVYAADYYSNFSAWLPYIGDSTLVLQTCEGNGARLVRCE